MPQHITNCIVRKSSSLPNISIQQSHQLNVSQTFSNSTVDSYGKMRTLLPMTHMPISSASESDNSPLPLQNSSSCNSIQAHHNQHQHQHQQHQQQNRHQHQQQNQPSFNLVKLFIKQKSSSTDTCMDVSSGCWPSDASSSGEQRQRKKSMNDSGKGI